ncbi:MAG: DUF309 domain-containing protein [Planctomycetota bacterium]
MEAHDPRLVEGLRLINEGRYFEAHEVLEDLWMAKVGEDKLFVQALIQADVGLHHRQNGNHAGAAKLFAYAAAKLGELSRPTIAGIVVSELAAQIAPLLAEARALDSGSVPAPDPALCLVVPVDPALPRPRYTIDDRGEVHFL